MYMWQRQWQGAVADSRGREQSAIVVHLQVSIVVWEVCMGGVCMGGVCMGGVCMGGVCMGGRPLALAQRLGLAPCALPICSPQKVFLNKSEIPPLIFRLVVPIIFIPQALADLDLISSLRPRSRSCAWRAVHE